MEWLGVLMLVFFLINKNILKFVGLEDFLYIGKYRIVYYMFTFGIVVFAYYIMNHNKFELGMPLFLISIVIGGTEYNYGAGNNKNEN